MVTIAAIILLVISWSHHHATGESFTGSLSADPNIIDGVLIVCTGSSISITCTHNNTASGVTRWEVTGFPNSSMDCNEVISFGENSQCGPFTLSWSSGPSVSTFISMAHTKATEVLNGTVVTCFSSGLDNNIVGNANISILGIPTPSITSVEQVSQFVVRVSMSVADSQCTCVGSYLVEATPVGGSGSTNTSSPTPTVDVSGLDVCWYNYSFVWSILTPGGEKSELSSPVSFSADLSVLNRITVTINQEDPLIEWVQGDNSLYPTCITGYLIEDQATSFNTTVSPTVRSLTAQQLNDAGFPYCANMHPTVSPITPMGPLETVQGSGSLYTIVTDPDFPTPTIRYAFTLLNETVILHINFPLPISNTTVPTRTYQYSFSRSTGTEEMSLTSNPISFTGDYFEFELSTEAAQAGCNISVTVIFQRDACRTMKTATFIVPARTIEGPTLGTPTDTNQTVTITLPLTEYQPEQLLIISTASAPEDDVTVMADFTSPSAQYTVTFTNLNPDTKYTFTIRIILCSNNITVQAISGTFTTAPPTTEEPPSLTPTGCDGGCIAGIIIAIILVVIAIIAIVIVVVVVCLVVLPNQKAKAAEKGQEMSTITRNCES